nr:MAG TPA: hypothetical protein [Caudoviricetes sp.]
MANICSAAIRQCVHHASSGIRTPPAPLPDGFYLKWLG